ncbi:MAG: (d)CMP kinase [Planctomycetota bacterium]
MTGESNSIVVTIDGPAGAGKSTVARRLAEQLGYDFLDTGALYRCVTLAVLRAGISLSNSIRIAALAESLTIEIHGTTAKINGEDVSQEIRTPKVASAIGLIADNIEVRSTLTELQRKWTQGRNVVTEGRDQGTEVFPDSPCKIFLVASPEERARRRMKELAERGIDMTYEQVLAQQLQRDSDDHARPVGALRQAEDAVEVNTDGLSLEDVVQHLLELARDKTG